MLFLAKLSNPYGKDVILNDFGSKPAARGFVSRFNKLMERPAAYVEELEADEVCTKCGDRLVDIIQRRTVHECEV